LRTIGASGLLGGLSLLGSISEASLRRLSQLQPGLDWQFTIGFHKGIQCYSSGIFYFQGTGSSTLLIFDFETKA
jgi:hypothetical protein